MKRISLLIAVIFSITIFAACSNSEESVAAGNMQNAQEQPANNENALQNGGQNANGEANMQARGNAVTGLVTDVVGNEITIQVGEMAGGMGGGMPSGEGLPEGMELPEGAEGFGGAGGMGDMTEEERAERQSAMENGEMPEGMGGRGEDANTEGARPEGMNGGEGAMGGGQGEMGGGMAQMEGEDYSEIITLTEEIKTYNVPITTPVVQFGTEMTFSQITEDMYVTIMLDENDNLTSINILS